MFGFFCPKQGQGDTEEPNTLSDRKQRCEQRIAQLFEFAARRDSYLAGAASRDLPEVGELDLQRDGAPARPGALAVAPDLVDDVSKLILRGFVGEQVDR